ncbi:hypothetical protein CANDROIZ_340005 [Candidatus Roizmanbacteria bacterium]|nr:hypothetical protein CANDROIZ_340005 [Candidatus Roizmanbacteria bacterium]
MNNVVDTGSHNNQYSIRDLQVQYNTIKELSTEIKEQRQSGGLVRAANRRLFDRLLEYAIPTKRADDTKDKRYKKYKAIARLFDKVRLTGTGTVKNMDLLRILKKQVYDRGRKRKVNSDDYRNNQKSYNQKLKNSLKFLNARWTTINYKTRFHSDYCELVSLNQKVAP